MKDLNFFKGYIEKKQFKANKKLLYLSMSIFIVLLFLTYSIYNYIIINQEAEIVNNLKTIAEDSELLERVGKIQKKEIQVNEFKDYIDKIRKLDEIIESKDIINESLLDTITLIMPESLFLTSIGINNNSMQLVGIAEEKWAIAEFGKGLEILDKVEEIFISNISLEENYYNFNINIIIEGGTVDEEELEEN